MTRPQRSHLRWVLAAACAAAAAITAVVLIEHFGREYFSFGVMSGGPESTSAPAPSAAPAEAPATMQLHEAPQALPELRFQDGSGQNLTLAEFEGKTVLLNIWATWCIPCRREMPTLDRLQSALGGPDFEVVALSIDRTGIDAVRQFYREIAIKHLAMYIDTNGKAATELGIVGLPTTLLIDGKGRELGRLVGPAEWDAPEMIDTIRRQITSRTGAAASEWRQQAARYGIAHKPLGLDLPVTRTPI